MKLLPLLTIENQIRLEIIALKSKLKSSKCSMAIMQKIKDLQDELILLSECK